MTKRMTLMLLVVAVLLGTIAAMKYRQTYATVAEAAFQPPPEAVTTIVARREEWAATLRSIGTVTAIHGVMVCADLPGVVHQISFDSGKMVHPDEPLVQLDTSQEQAQLAAAEAQRNLARLSIDRIRGLRSEGVVSQAEYDAAAARFDEAEAKVAEIAATIARKTIKAPFAGVLGLRQVNLGQYLKSGDPIVPLQSLNPIYVNFGAPQQNINKLRAGAEVRVTAEGLEPLGNVGRITAIDSIVDKATRNIQVQATLDNKTNVLRPGMFVDVLVLTGKTTPVVALPASAINYAPYGNSVFIVENIKGPEGGTYRGVRQQFVKLGDARGDQLAVLSGVSPGDEVVTSGVFKLRDGAAVLVNNQVQPTNSSKPSPEDS